MSVAGRLRSTDGAVWQFRFTGDGCAFARPASAQASGARANKLPELLRGWFEALVAAPDEDPREPLREVRFAASPDGLWVAPVDAALAPPRPLRLIAEYHDLAAAARHRENAAEASGRIVMLPVAADGRELFAVRIAGTAWDRGSEPLRDGDWAVFRVGDGLGAGRAEPSRPSGGSVYPRMLEALVDQVASPRLDAQPHAVVQPEQLAPRVGTLLTEGQIGPAFNLPALASLKAEVGGHRFVWIHTEGVLVAPDRLAADAPRHAGETSGARGVGAAPRRWP